jgi:hypothetical protein
MAWTSTLPCSAVWASASELNISEMREQDKQGWGNKVGDSEAMADVRAPTAGYRK